MICLPYSTMKWMNCTMHETFLCWPRKPTWCLDWPNIFEENKKKNPEYHFQHCEFMYNLIIIKNKKKRTKKEQEEKKRTCLVSKKSPPPPPHSPSSSSASSSLKPYSIYFVLLYEFYFYFVPIKAFFWVPAQSIMSFLTIAPKDSPSRC